METFSVTIKGLSPLLINAFTQDFGQDQKVELKKKGADHGTPREQMEKRLYVDKKGLVVVPTTWLKGSLMDCASEYKLPGSRKSLKSVMGGVVIPIDEFMAFKKKMKKFDVEVDSRPVAIQRASSKIMRHRGRVDCPWELSCQIQIEGSIVPSKTILEVLNDAGKRAGIGDFRPSRGGSFGRFQVSKWSKVRG